MSWRLPELQEDKNVLVATKYASNYLQSVAGILTCLSLEAKRNELTSMAFVLTELADGICLSTEKVETLVRKVERMQEKNEEKFII
jgi:hypothetical protein